MLASKKKKTPEVDRHSDTDLLKILLSKAMDFLFNPQMFQVFLLTLSEIMILPLFSRSLQISCPGQVRMHAALEIQADSSSVVLLHAVLLLTAEVWRDGA